MIEWVFIKDSEGNRTEDYISECGMYKAVNKQKVSKNGEMMYGVYRRGTDLGWWFMAEMDVRSCSGFCSGFEVAMNTQSRWA